MVNLAQTPSPQVTLDGNEAAASVAYRLNEIFAIYPITPSSPMAELCDEWSSLGKPNIWGDVPSVVQMQSEAGVAGTLHGILQGGVLTTSFTASQGLLLMIPNLYKIAGELTPFVLHVTARTVATHALSIFGDHSDVMSCRGTGMTMLVSRSVQEAHDMAAVAHLATMRTRIPVLHFFDGFRTSHEVAKVRLIEDDVLRSLWPVAPTAEFRKRALSPEHPVIRGTAQNPDVFFQAREAINPFYDAAPGILQEVMDDFAEATGRRYQLFEYSGHPEPETVVVIMGSGSETVEETVSWYNQQGGKAGMINARVYRPFHIESFLKCLPPSVKKLVVLDRCKEPGAVGEPLYTDVAAALWTKSNEMVGTTLHGGIYGLGSKEFSPGMVASILEHAATDRLPRHFTIGIEDDVSHRSLPYDPDLSILPESTFNAVFFGLGADGTVGANKNSIKIIGEETENFAQGYFVYDSKKSGAVTVSHLRFGPSPIRAPYLIRKAAFVGCHQFTLLEKQPVEIHLSEGGTLLLNATGDVADLWDKLPAKLQQVILAKKVKVYAIDAYSVARESGLGGRINTIMQVCFFALAGGMDKDKAIASIKEAIDKTYGRKGREIVQRNWKAVDSSLAALHSVPVGETAREITPSWNPFDEAPEFVQRVTRAINDGFGDRLPVSCFPPDGTWPTGTTQYEKRNIAAEIPVWDPDVCIQCNKCALVCPHAAIRPKFFAPEEAEGAPETFKTTAFKSREMPGLLYALQVAPEDCTGCTICVQVCPAKNRKVPRLKAINMEPQPPLLEAERENYRFFLEIPPPDRTVVTADIKGSQFLDPLFEYSGACAGCGETPYIKLLSQLIGDRLVIANATGCSSIYGGNLPTTPYSVDRNGRGPAWANSLFEDNAEFGYGLRLALNQLEVRTRGLVREHASLLGDTLTASLLAERDTGEEAMSEARSAVAALREKLSQLKSPKSAELLLLSEYLIPRSVWVIGGDGWAYDIGFGGLDHVMSCPEKIRILVLDTEVYSNTGGQCSKATPLAASAKFSIAGKETAKKDLALQAVGYGHAYVARVAFGSRDIQTLNALREAESFPGPALVIAYSHCIAHGYDMKHGLEQQKLAVETGSWPLYRFDPRRRAEGKSPLVLDSPAPKTNLTQYLQNELRFRSILQANPARAESLQKESQEIVRERYQFLAKLAESLTPADTSVDGANS